MSFLHRDIIQSKYGHCNTMFGDNATGYANYLKLFKTGKGRLAKSDDGVLRLFLSPLSFSYALPLSAATRRSIDIYFIYISVRVYETHVISVVPWRRCAMKKAEN